MSKKIIYSICITGIALTLGACSASQIPKEETNPLITQKEQDENHANKTDPSKDNKTVNDNFEGMEIDGTSNVTMDQLIAQLKKDGIVEGTPKDIKDVVPGALHTTQIDNALIIEFDSKDLRAFTKTYEAQSVTYQNKDYKITAINGQFMLVLLDPSNSEKAAASFQQSQSGDVRLINF